MLKILKFGGSSVSSPERIKNVIEIVKNQLHSGDEIAVVVSALGGTTDALIHYGQLAAQGQVEYRKELQNLENRHLEAAQQLISEENLTACTEHLLQYFKELNDVMHGIFLIKELSKRTLDYIMSFGERLSAYLISEAMKPVIPHATFVDARELIKTDRSFGGARVDFVQTTQNLQQRFSNLTFVPIITGFIGSSSAQETTTLGRGGSDYTAAIIGAALNADVIEIWTDVDGVMTADPRKVRQAFPIPQITYKEALEMSHFGAKVIHPPTIAPALQKNIPIHIKNTFNPQGTGTLISRHHVSGHRSLICGISSIDNIALLRVEGSGMVGVCGIAMRLFGALAKNEINVILISQGSSEHSICFAIDPQSADLAKEAIEEEFSLERHAGLIDPVVIELDLSIVAIVGEKMRRTPGISGKLFGSLGKNGINVTAMVQGSSEYNISVVVKKEDEAKALNVLHEEFFLSLTTTLHLFLIGTGLIGKTLLSQIHRQLPLLRDEQALDLRIVGIADSKKMSFDPHGIAIQHLEEELKHSSERMDISTFVNRMKSYNLMNSVFIDCTASDAIANAYPTILEANISIVTPNKRANSGSYANYKTLKELSKRKGVKFLYETNVGAGLPVISTVIDLLRSGDKIIKIEAILSGTLSYIFNSFTNGKNFSETVREAQEKGFTEPDPREDLNGQDVMRKLLILARESGYPLEMEDISIESILPQSCFEAPDVETFYKKLEECNALFDQKKMQAAQEGKVLRYIATLDEGKASITLLACDSRHPFFHLSGSDNIIAITTERYRETPLVIKGQGAGAEVTAGEIFADIIRIAYQ